MGEQEVKDSGAAHPARGNRRRRRRKPRRGDAPARSESPTQVIARVTEAKPSLLDKSVEEPLSPEELAELRQHLRFLRDHRRILHLRVNAQEDLLLNEVRQPTRRGVCLHLLSKVDRAHVFSAAERLDPAAATRLAEGVLRISPNIDYLLLYLDCVRRSQAGKQAVAALSHALEQIDLRSLSPGQMRRVLDLVVELFDRRELPLMLLGMLESAAFREAFDASVAELPEALAELVVPLRAAQAVVLRKKSNRFGPNALMRGVRLLLESDASALLKRPAGVRRRLLELAIGSGAAADAALTTALRALLESLESDPNRSRLTLELGRAWIVGGRESEAKQLLQALSRAQPELEEAKRWLAALDKPRVGRVALLEGNRAPSRNRAAAVFLDTMQRATLLQVESDELELIRAALVPGVAPVLDSGSDEAGKPWLAVARPGQRLTFVLERRRGIPRGVLLSIGAETAYVLAGLAGLGLSLPDARLARFELDDSDRLWLTDLSGVRRASVDESERAHASLIARLYHDLFAAVSYELPPEGLLEQLQKCDRTADAVALVARNLVAPERN